MNFLLSVKDFVEAAPSLLTFARIPRHEVAATVMELDENDKRPLWRLVRMCRRRSQLRRHRHNSIVPISDAPDVLSISDAKLVGSTRILASLGRRRGPSRNLYQRVIMH